jgi:hypothetical protein
MHPDEEISMLEIIGILLLSFTFAVLVVWMYRTLKGLYGHEAQVVEISTRKRRSRPQRQKGLVGTRASSPRKKPVKRERAGHRSGLSSRAHKASRRKAIVNPEPIRKPWGW